MPDPLSVVHLNPKDAANGGARAAYRLHRGLYEEDDVASSMFVESKLTQDSTVQAFDPPTELWVRLRRRVWRERIDYEFSQYRESIPDRAELFSDDRSPHRGDVLEQCPSADVLNLHAVYGFIDHKSFFRRVTVPVVWTLHDMNAFTGGCQYNVGCTRYRQSCGRCPQLGSDTENDLSHEVWARKKTAFQHVIDDDRLRVVCPSQWMANEARQSSLFTGAPVKVIPYGLDATTFRPRPVDGVPSALGIPSDHRIVLFLASDTDRTRKGFGLLDEAVSGLGTKKTTLVSVGGGTPDLSASQPHVHLGHVKSDLLLSVFYSLADLFVIPSRQDNLPNTVLESMACGTPVVGFDTGGIPDMVRPSETGWLAEAENVRSLREAIEAALVNEARRERMGTRCRAVVEEEYTLEVQARRYRRLYEQMLSGWGN